MLSGPMAKSALASFHPAVGAWFEGALGAPTRVQSLAWPKIAAGETTLLLAPTGSGKTLAAFLAAIDRLAREPEDDPDKRLRVLYVSPLKALAVDVERNLRAPLVGVVETAARMGASLARPEVFVRTGDTPAQERARAMRAALEGLTVEEVFDEGLHEFLSRTIRSASDLASLIHEAYLSGGLH